MKQIIADGILSDSTKYFPQGDGNTVLNIFNYVYGILGIIAVIVGIYAGIQLIISLGNSEKVATARRTFIYAIVGLVVIMSASVITTFIVRRLS